LIVTNRYSDNGSPIFVIGLVDSTDPNLNQVRSILEYIFYDGRFRIMELINSQGGCLTALYTGIEISREEIDSLLLEEYRLPDGDYALNFIIP